MGRLQLGDVGRSDVNNQRLQPCGMEVSHDLVVACRCGFAGTPDSLAWMGDRCGPCSDRAQEGLPELGFPVVRPFGQGGRSILRLEETFSIFPSLERKWMLLAVGVIRIAQRDLGLAVKQTFHYFQTLHE